MNKKENIAECAKWVMDNAKLLSDARPILLSKMENSGAYQASLFERDIILTQDQVLFIVACRLGMIAQSLIPNTAPIVTSGNGLAVRLPPIKFGARTSHSAMMKLIVKQSQNMFPQTPYQLSTTIPNLHSNTLVAIRLMDLSGVNPHASKDEGGEMCIGRDSYKSLVGALENMQWQRCYMTAVSTVSTYNPGREFTLVSRAITCHITGENISRSRAQHCKRCKRRIAVSGYTCPECYILSCGKEYHDTCSFVDMPFVHLPIYSKFCTTCNRYAVRNLPPEETKQMKPCSNQNCNNSKLSIPISNFRKDAGATDGHKSRCKECCDA